MTPVRSCVGCGERGSQDGLLRIVWRQGELRPDPARRAGGRGAYLHPRRACWQRFVGRRGLVRSLRTSVPRPARERLVDALGGMTPGEEE